MEGSSYLDFMVLPCVLRRIFPQNLNINLNYLPASFLVVFFFFLYLHQYLQRVHCLNTWVGGTRLGVHWEQRGFGLLKGLTSKWNFTFAKKWDFISLNSPVLPHLFRWVMCQQGEPRSSLKWEPAFGRERWAGLMQQTKPVLPAYSNRTGTKEKFKMNL